MLIILLPDKRGILGTDQDSLPVASPAKPRELDHVTLPTALLSVAVPEMVTVDKEVT